MMEATIFLILWCYWRIFAAILSLLEFNCAAVSIPIKDSLLLFRSTLRTGTTSVIFLIFKDISSEHPSLHQNEQACLGFMKSGGHRGSKYIPTLFGKNNRGAIVKSYVT